MKGKTILQAMLFVKPYSKGNKSLIMISITNTMIKLMFTYRITGLVLNISHKAIISRLPITTLVNSDENDKSRSIAPFQLPPSYLKQFFQFVNYFHFIVFLLQQCGNQTYSSNIIINYCKAIFKLAN